jgi:hypothetical protein
LWAALIARIYEVLPLLCPNCGGQMRIIGFITYSADIRHILGKSGTRRSRRASGLGVWAAEGETPDAKLNRLRMMGG